MTWICSRECLSVSFISAFIKFGGRNFQLTPLNLTSFWVTTCMHTKNGGKNAWLGIKVLYKSEYSTQIWLTCGIFLFVHLIDCEINLLLTFGTAYTVAHKKWNITARYINETSYGFVVYFMTLSVTQTRQHQMVEWLVNNELKRVWKELFWSNIRLYPSICLRDWRMPWQNSVRKDGLWVWNWHIPKNKQECQLSANNSVILHEDNIMQLPSNFVK